MYFELTSNEENVELVHRERIPPQGKLAHNKSKVVTNLEHQTLTLKDFTCILKSSILFVFNFPLFTTINRNEGYLVIHRESQTT